MHGRCGVERSHARSSLSGQRASVSEHVQPLLNPRFGHWAAQLCTWLLNNVFLMKELGLDKVQPLFALNGFLLWLSYIVLRLILFPFWLYTYASDTRSHPDTTLAFLTPMEQVCGRPARPP
jgi:hypothetical protein